MPSDVRPRPRGRGRRRRHCRRRDAALAGRSTPLTILPAGTANNIAASRSGNPPPLSLPVRRAGCVRLVPPPSVGLRLDDAPWGPGARELTANVGPAVEVLFREPWGAPRGGEHLRLVRRDGWEYVEHLDGRHSVAAFATTPAGEVVLIEQRRVPVGALVLELPAGIVDPGETPEDSVLRELHEETGYTAASPPTLLLSSPILAGLTSTILHLFRIRCGPRTGPGGGLADETITVRLVPLTQLDAAVAASAAVDWHLLAALHLTRARDQSTIRVPPAIHPPRRRCRGATGRRPAWR